MSYIHKKPKCGDTVKILHGWGDVGLWGTLEREISNGFWLIKRCDGVMTRKYYYDFEIMDY